MKNDLIRAIISVPLPLSGGCGYQSVEILSWNCLVFGSHYKNDKRVVH